MVAAQNTHAGEKDITRKTRRCALFATYLRSFGYLRDLPEQHHPDARRQYAWGYSSWPSGLPGSLATCWCGETGKRSDLASHWANALVGSNPITSTLAFTLDSADCFADVFHTCEVTA